MSSPQALTHERLILPTPEALPPASYRSPFVSPLDKRADADRARLAFEIGQSDHLTVLRAYDAWRVERARGGSAEWDFCRANFLSVQVRLYAPRGWYAQCGACLACCLQTLRHIADLKAQFVELVTPLSLARPSARPLPPPFPVVRAGAGACELTPRPAQLTDIDFVWPSASDRAGTLALK